MASESVLVIAFLSGSLALALPPAHADLTFTWHTDSGDDVTGSFTLVSAALTNPANLTSADFTSISFTVTASGSTYFFDAFSASEHVGFNSNGDPATSNAVIVFSTSSNQYDDLVFDLNTSWSASGAELFGSDSYAFEGTGHWTITTAAAAPEPSTAFLTVTGAVAMIGYGWLRRRRAQRCR